jgi:hypothetical protein
MAELHHWLSAVLRRHSVGRLLGRSVAAATKATTSTSTTTATVATTTANFAAVDLRLFAQERVRQVFHFRVKHVPFRSCGPVPGLVPQVGKRERRMMGLRKGIVHRGRMSMGMPSRRHQ